ncbi:glycosyltransferase family 4 protein [Kaistella sp. 97-N-M2]|uniref:MraY family glycosyltransferase n=1 Tax=Kaistella sp. 97-N-M2 TaxID=2908645 RepID=UPI001F423F15|nr:glycosyltransferase family 4 protein [Kaistella sp. 97-N-M2]UJF28815.1 glycosyltransferase family 4 protein [Kaistella sp. 97-N-M2]
MEYLIITAAFFLMMLIYFRIADRFNIIDKPNHRSAHTEVTIRGAGIIIPIAYLLFIGSLIFSRDHKINEADGSPNFLIFGLGLLLICIISFMDDLMDLSTKIRLVFHFISVSLLLYFINAFQLFPIWSIPICYILIIGILNAYNFMDGINGMSGLFSLVILGSLLYVNHYVVTFVGDNFIIYPLLAALVFLFFNFRLKAKCFLGDIGSMALAFWIVALLAMLMLKTWQIKWILFLSVYGIETIFTILERLKLKENIFTAHRRHLYQLLVNDKKLSHLYVSTTYASLQIFINALIITLKWPNWVCLLVLLFPLAIIYILIKLKIKRRI